MNSTHFNTGDPNGSFVQHALRQCADISKVAVTLGIVESVSHNKFVGDGEADIIPFDFLDATRRFVEQRSDFKGFRLMVEQQPAKISERKAGIENVLDQDNVASLH